MQELLDLAHKKLGYLKIVTPRLPGDGLDTGGSFVVDSSGDVVAGRAAAVDSAKHKTFTAGNLDPDDIKRHNANLRRFHFGDHDRPPGMFE